LRKKLIKYALLRILYYVFDCININTELANWQNNPREAELPKYALYLTFFSSTVQIPHLTRRYLPNLSFTLFSNRIRAKLLKE
jgi:hypothetical protein